MKVILSCTTTYERINLFYYGVQSLLNQTIKPDLFLVNISKEKYLNDSGFSQLPEWLLKDKIRINWVPNTGPYRKLLPAISIADSDDIIITADDDVLYHKYWLKELVQLHDLNPNSIVCARARMMEKNMFGIWKNYNTWEYSKKKLEDINNIPIGCGGILYKKNLLDLDFLIDKKYLEIAPTTDDLWFKKASMRNEIPVLVDPKIDEESIYLQHLKGMYDGNKSNTKFKYSFIPNRLWNYLGVDLNKNDICWGNICKYSEKLPKIT